MSASSERKKPPPPIFVPPLHPLRPIPGPNAFALEANSEKRGSRSKSRERTVVNRAAHAIGDSTYPRPMEVGEPRSASLKARGSSRKSEYASSASASSRHNSTTRTKYSDRSQSAAAAMAAQAHLETLGDDDMSNRSGKSTMRSRHANQSQSGVVIDQAGLQAPNRDEKTSRSLIEARTERKLFKMMGQVPPTPVDGVPPEVPDGFIRTTDLRSQYKSQESEKEPPKSPKKKIFGVTLPTFNRASGNVPVPEMPSKAAQVFGTDSAKKTRRIEARPTKPSGYYRHTGKTPRSDTSRSLPSKLYEHQSHAHSRRHASGSARRRAATRKMAAGAIRSSPSKTNDAPTLALTKSVSPPTPPEKDTPPDSKPRLFHVRQHSKNSSCDRESSEGFAIDTGMKVAVPRLSVIPTLEPGIPVYGSDSPAKFQPYTADDYAKLIDRDLIHSTYAQIDQADESDTDEDHRSSDASMEEERGTAYSSGALQWMEDNYHQSHFNSCNDRDLLPRFYTPSDCSTQAFPKGGRPSKNTDSDRFLFSVPQNPYIGEAPSHGSGSIEMVFQGEASEIDPGSAMSRMVHSASQGMTSPQKGEGHDSAARDIQNDGKKEAVLRGGGHLHPEYSVSGLTDMLNACSPYKQGIKGDFKPNCPSAVPSPLYRGPKQHPPLSAITHGSQPLPRSPRTMEDHFYMTNEHVDVAGKILHDFVAKCHQQEISVLTSKHDQLVAKIEKHVADIKSQISSVNEKADHAANQNHNIHMLLDNFLSFMKTDVVEPLATQTKRIADMEAHMNEIKSTVKDLQLSLEQKIVDGKSNQQMHPGAYPTPVPAQPSYPPMPHRSQHSLLGYFDSPPQESGGDPAFRQAYVQENANVNAGADGNRGDARLRYGGGYNTPNWSSRYGFPPREMKDEPTSYHMTGNGQYGNGYVGNYPNGFSQTPPTQHFSFHPSNGPK